MPILQPLFELISPVFGDLRFVWLSKVKGFGVAIIEDAVIILEFNRSAGSFKTAVGAENGLIMTYYDSHLPFSILNFSFNEQTSELFFVDTRGGVAQL